VLSTLAAGGTLSVTATTGSISTILPSAPVLSDLNLYGTTAQVTLSAVTGIGRSNGNIEADIAELTLTNSGSGTVYINQTQTGALQLGTGTGNAVTVGGTTATTSIVTSDGDISVLGAVISTATGGTAGQTGHILIQSNRGVASSANIVVSANIQSSSGSIEINSAGGISLGVSAPITVAANALHETVELQAVANIGLAPATIVSADGNIWIDAVGGGVALGEVRSAEGLVDVDAGNTITNAQTNAQQTIANVTAGSIRLNGAYGIGSSSNLLELSGGTSALTMAAASSAGGIYVLSQSAVTVAAVGAVPVNVIGASATPGTAGDSNTLTSVSVYGASNLVLQSQDALTVAYAINMAGPVVGQSSAVLLEAAGLLSLNASLGNTGGAFTSYTGNISLWGGGGVVVAPAVQVKTLSGTIDVESASAGVQMGAASLLSSTSGAIQVLAYGALGLAELSTGGNVVLQASNGSILDTNGNTNSTSIGLNVIANGLLLNAAANIGSSVDGMQTQITVLTANSANGSIYVNDKQALSIGTVGATVQVVGLTGALTPMIDGNQSGVSAGGSGNVVLEDSSGDFTVNSAVTAAGAGNVLLQAQTGNLWILADVSSVTGDLTLQGAAGVSVGAANTVETVSTGGSGALEIESSAGSISQSADSVFRNAGAAVRLAAAQNVAVAEIISTGNVEISALAGSISDANGNADGSVGTLNVQASALYLNAANGGVGLNTDALLTQVSTLSANAAAGGIFILNSGTVTVGSVTVNSRQVQQTGSSTAISDAAQAGLVTSGAGNIVLQTSTGDLTVSSDSSTVPGVNAVGTTGSNTNILLQAQTGTLNLNANVDVSGSSTGNGSGSLSLLGITGVNMAAAVVVSTGSGTMDVESGQNVVMGAASVLNSGSGRIGVVASGAIALAEVQTSSGVALTANGGSILDANGNANGVSARTENVLATALRLYASNGLGLATDALSTQVTSLSASAGAGGVYLLNDQSETISHVAVSVNQVAQNGIVGTQLSQSSQGGVVTSANGNVVLQASAGNITLNRASSSSTLPAVNANGSGNVLVQSLAGSVAVNANIYTSAGAAGNGSGNISVLGYSGVTVAKIAGQSTIGTGSGTLDLESGAGSVTMASGSLITSVGAAVNVKAAQDVNVGRVVAGANVALTAVNGSVADANGNVSTSGNGVLNVQASGLSLQAAVGLGSSTDALRTQVSTLAEQVGASGAYLINNQTLTVGSVSVSIEQVQQSAAAVLVVESTEAGLVSSANGNLVLDVTSGNLTLTSAAPATPSVSANGSGNVLLEALGGTLNDSANVSSGSGNITVLGSAGVSVGFNNTTVQISTTAGTVDVESVAGNIAMSAGSVVKSQDKAVRMNAATGIALATVVAGTDVSLDAGTGSILDSNANSNRNGLGRLNIQSNGARLKAGAGAGAGSGTDALQLQVNTLSTNVGAGGAYLLSDQTVTVAGVSATINKVGLNGATSTVLDVLQASLISSNSGNLVLQALAGDVDLTSASSAPAIGAIGNGSVLVQALVGTVNVQANVYSSAVNGLGDGSGAITLLGASGVNVGQTGTFVTVSTGAGTLDVESSGGSVLMGGQSVLASAGADIRVWAAQNIGLAEVHGGANVALTAAAGSILDANGNADGASGNVLNVQSNTLRLSAGVGAGSATDALQTQVNVVSASVGAGGLYLINDQALSINAVAASVNQVGLNGSTSAVVDAAHSGLSSASGGNLVLQSQSGALTVGTAVNANASGNVLLQASAGAVNVQALVQSGSGAISVLGSSGVVLSANMGVSTGTGTGAGTLDVESSGGSVLMGSNSELQASANVNVQAAQSIGLAQIVSGAGVALTASAGSISNATQASNNVTAQTLYLNAGAGAGQSAQALQTQVNTLSAALGSAGLYLRNDQTLSSNSVSVSVGKVGLNGATSVVTQATLADAIVSAGTVVLQTSSGDVNLNSASASVAAIKANGSANVLVQALAGAVSVNANVQNGSAASVGNVSLQALGANANVVVGSNGVAVSVSDGAGSVDVESGAGSVVMGANSVLSSQSGNVRLAGAQNVVLAQVSTGASVSVKAGAGSITDANGNLNSNSAGVQNVVASALMLNAAGSVGVASDALRTQVSTVSAVAGAGGIALLNDQSETVGTVAVSVNQVNALGATDLVSDAALAGLFTSANGNITLQSTVGDITLTSATNTNPSGVPAISANGSGNVLVQTLSSSASVNVLGNIVSGSGNINVLGGLNVVLYTPATGAALIGTGTPGLVNVLAGAGEVISGGTTQPGQTVNLNSNTLSLQAPLIGSGNLLNIAPATGSGTPAAVVVGGTPANAAGALYLSQAQTALIQAGFSDVQIGSSRAGQVVSLVGQNGQGVASNNRHASSLTLRMAAVLSPLLSMVIFSGRSCKIDGAFQVTPCCGQIPLGGKQEVHRVAALVDCAVQILPLACHF